MQYSIFILFKNNFKLPFPLQFDNQHVALFQIGSII